MSDIVTNLFLSIDRYASLNPSSVSNIGELSKKSLSYSKDINLISIEDGLSVNVFYTRTVNVSGELSLRTLDTVDKTNIKSVLSFYYSETETATNEIAIPTLIGKFSQRFSNISDLYFETIITTTTNKKYYGYLSFSMTDNNIKRTYNVWCSDGIFQSDYPVTEYIVVPVYSNLNDFWKTPITVISDLEANNPYGHIDRVQALVGEYPPTGVLWLDYPYIDPGNASIGIPVKWAIIYYGSAASSDSVKAALVKYLTTNNTHTSAQWKTIFPDIFTSTKFVLYPMWNDYAITNMQVGQTGVFKNNFKIKSIIDKAKLYFTDYSAVDVENKLHYMPMPYKSIGVVSMPGQDNPNSRMSIDSIYDDIINVTSVSADFNRMDFDTQEFLDLLSKCLTIGETFNNTTSLPAKVYRVIRLGKPHMAFTHNGIEFIVAPKSAV